MKADEWLARAMVRMIISDSHLDAMEWKTLKYSLNKLNLDLDTDQIYEMLGKTRGPSADELKLVPFTGIDLDTKVKMLLKLAKVAALDESVVERESEFLRKAAALLGLNRIIGEEILKWARAQTQLNKMEKELYEIARQYEKY